MLINLDKHRSPIQLGVVTGASFSVQEAVIAPDANDPDRFIVQSKPTLDAQRHDGKPLHATLMRLCHAVNETLETFSDVLSGPQPRHRPPSQER